MKLPAFVVTDGGGAQFRGRLCVLTPFRVSCPALVPRSIRQSGLPVAHNRTAGLHHQATDLASKWIEQSSLYDDGYFVAADGTCGANDCGVRLLTGIAPCQVLAPHPGHALPTRRFRSLPRVPAGRTSSCHVRERRVLQCTQVPKRHSCDAVVLIVPHPLHLQRSHTCSTSRVAPQRGHLQRFHE